MNNQYAGSSSLGRDRSTNKGDVFHIPILQLRKQDTKVKILEILCLGLVSVEAGLEVLLVVCTCLGVSLPNTALDKCLCAVPTSESLSQRRFPWQEGNNFCSAYYILSVGKPLCKAGLLWVAGQEQFSYKCQPDLCKLIKLSIGSIAYTWFSKVIVLF